jgi:EAL domain-containing protein (putative c-di-GMP-specific phosphodiesterase class I)
MRAQRVHRCGTRLTLVAEGVETASQVDFLKGSRCDVFQGYYSAKPMLCVEIEAFRSHPAPPSLTANSVGSQT